jgi:hypothetical protein
MDPKRDDDNGTDMLHNSDTGRGHNDDEDSTSSITTIESPAPTATPMDTTDYPTVHTRLLEPTGRNSLGNTSTEQDSRNVPESRRSYHTFILHTNNIIRKWKLQVTQSSRTGPTFLLFDHGDHLHIIYSSLS